MRFTIICLVSLLLVPALGASPPQRRSNRPPVPEHGEVVKYQAGVGPRFGVVLGTKPHPAGPTGNIKLAPLTSHSLPPSPGTITAHANEVVTTQPGHIVRTGYHAPLLALNIDSQHDVYPPQFRHFALGPVKGSPNYQDRPKKTSKS